VSTRAAALHCAALVVASRVANQSPTCSLVKIYYSLGRAALKAVTEFVPAALSGEGQFQLGILKKPTGTSDVANSGYQESPLKEGQIYGGMFVEDSTGGCVSL
jgi:hypothetical protein